MPEPTIVFAPLLEPDVRAIADECRPSRFEFRNVARADVDALLVPPGDAPALRRALQSVLDSRGLRDRLIEAGRRRADEFSMARLAGMYLELYERVLVPAR